MSNLIELAGSLSPFFEWFVSVRGRGENPSCCCHIKPSYRTGLNYPLHLLHHQLDIIRYLSLSVCSSFCFLVSLSLSLLLSSLFLRNTFFWNTYIDHPFLASQSVHTLLLCCQRESENTKPNNSQLQATTTTTSLQKQIMTLTFSNFLTLLIKIRFSY